MTTETDLDRAHAAMEAGGDADRLAFYQLLADSELILWLEDEPDGDTINPHLLTTDGASYVLGFDTEDRLAGLAQNPAPRMSLSGRALAHMLAGQGIGLALNMGDAPSAILLPPETMEWLVATLGRMDVEETGQMPVGFSSLAGDHGPLTAALGTRLAAAAGHAQTAYLAQAHYGDDGSGLFLAITGADSSAEDPLRTAAHEALVFSGTDQPLDVAFLTHDHPAIRALKGKALELDLTFVPDPTPALTPPGTDPSKPPRLK